MEHIKLIALRDFAVEHMPRAQKVSRLMPADQYHTTLYGLTALVSPTATAAQQAAAELLQTVLSLLIEWGDDVKLTADDRRIAEAKAIQQTMELCALTGLTIAWLPTLPQLGEAVELLQPTQKPLVVEATLPEAATATSPPPVQLHGETQTTRAAAAYLGVTEQTMRAWASNDNGPLVPIKQGTRNGWRTEDLVRLKRDGWKARGRKMPTA